MPKVSGSVRGRTSSGFPAGSPPGPSARQSLRAAPGLTGPPAQRRARGRKGPRLEVAAAFRRLGAGSWDPGPGQHRTQALAAAPAQPTCRGPHRGQPHPLPGPGAPPASSAAGDGGCARREIQRSRHSGSYLRWALSSRPGCPGPPAACR